MFAKHVRTEEREVNEMPVGRFLSGSSLEAFEVLMQEGNPCLPDRDRKWRFPVFFAETQRFQDTRRW